VWPYFDIKLSEVMKKNIKNSGSVPLRCGGCPVQFTQILTELSEEFPAHELLFAYGPDTHFMTPSSMYLTSNPVILIYSTECYFKLQSSQAISSSLSLKGIEKSSLSLGAPRGFL
jgi:hypothetical protein